MVEDHQRKIKQLLLNEKGKVNFREDIPKAIICLNHDDWTNDEIDWGVTNQIIFQILDPTYWTSFPMMIRTMLSCVASTYTWNKYFTLWVSSSIGWRECERFYQPYQIWYFKPTNDWEFEQETNPLHSKFVLLTLDLVEYWIESLLRLSQHATQIQGTIPTPFMVTDGRRIFVTNFPISYERSEEQIQEVEALLNDIKKRVNLDLPMELTIQADSIEEDRNMQFSQDPNSPLSSEDYDGVEYQNLIN
ncbi:hypothetical protein Vadar_003717 [Vaccinium darrowii]|uniref:Uncharacterized protein n=1 Tax=Vaccinium darrowii TaxID=229202 RepID=A0ACB7YIS9_9ERIC|nr:hypothetical protein Vadar_003717 [Vaccinium darrowii]